jgi:hypothetical protein
MNVTLDIPTDIFDRLQLAARAQGKDVETYLVDDVRRQFRSDVLSDVETSLLATINRPIDVGLLRKRNRLLSLKEKRELTEEEEVQLRANIDAVEMANAARWQALASLAKLRGMTLTELARDLQIPPH